MTELRRRKEDDMVARGFAARTRESYLWVFATRLGARRRSTRGQQRIPTRPLPASFICRSWGGAPIELSPPDVSLLRRASWPVRGPKATGRRRDGRGLYGGCMTCSRERSDHVLPTDR